VTTTLTRPRPPEPPEPPDDEALDEVWEDEPGIPGFLTTVDHKRIGIRYIVTSFIFFSIAGLMALVMRTQLAVPDAGLISPDAYNGLFTVHGTMMIFLFNTPVLAGFGNYLLPLMIGTRDMAFPRLNAFSYWVFLFAGIFFFAGFASGHAPNGGWFAYTPLTDRNYSPGVNLDFWGLGIAFVGISTTVGAVNFIVTTIKMRAPGLTLNRLPLYVWSMLVFSFMVLFSVPVVTVAAALLEMDRLFHTAFFMPAAGGSALVYQHLFWFWGHPEVYILFIPATGMMSMIFSVFSRRPIAGYIWIVIALLSIGFISFGVWIHHMFVTGLPLLATAFFSAASLVIAIPSGIQFFAWIATMWRGVVQLKTPMLFAIGFLLIFLLGGITGVMVAVLPFDYQVTQSYFIVSHLHYVLNGAVVFPIFGALYYWGPKMTGRLLDERLGKISFYTMFIGFNVAFFPMAILGLLGMPRRVYTYPSGLGWDALNLIATVGGFVFAFGVLLTFINIAKSHRRGVPAGPDPWGADSLEWATDSPPPDYNFRAIPVVESRHPLWDQSPLPVATSGGDAATEAFGAEGALRRTTPFTTGLRAEPESTMVIPEPTALPFVMALGLAILVSALLLTTLLVAALGVAIGAVALLRWTWRIGEH
jgi:cytochrome c oxidase subunit 1/cytochrome c oxidase subunit I+III